MSFSEFKIHDDDDGQRIDRLLRRLNPHWPYVFVQKLLRKGAVKIDGKRAKVDARVAVGQTIRVPRDDDDSQSLGLGPRAPRRKRSSAYAEDLIQVIFEDDHILVIDKPVGLAVQGGSGLKIHLEMMLDRFTKRGVNPRLVHRLDRETSGVMVLARGAAVARHLGDQFRERSVQKTYLAVVSPPPRQKSGTIDAALAKIKSGPYLENMQVARNGDPAQTDFEVLSVASLGLGRGSRAAKDPRAKPDGQKRYALVAFTPHTGRTHQIRVHAAHIGCPLVGDVKYGGDVDVMKNAKIKPRVMLHARELSFVHPKFDERLVFAADVPGDMTALCATLGLEIS
jgi:23S rRNA pseudouridine955/2504/2580 synthase